MKNERKELSERLLNFAAIVIKKELKNIIGKSVVTAKKTILQFAF